MRDVRSSDPANPAQRVALLRWMIHARLLDERIGSLYRQGAIPGKVFLGKGQEALSAALGMHLRQPRPGRRGDIYAPLIRDMAGRLAFGELPLEIARVHFMRSTSVMRGRDGNIHRGDLAKNTLPMISHLGAMLAPINGMLLARKLRGELGDNVGATCIGDGGMQTGAFHEGLNQAAVEKLPLIVVAADNQVSYSTFSDRTYACRSLVERASGYGVHGTLIDGTDADACLTTLHQAVARARAGDGPQLIVATLLRGAGHGEHDDASYVPNELKARFPDCLSRYEQTLFAANLATEADIIALRNEATAEIRAAFQAAQAEPEPTPASEDWRCLVSEHLASELQDWDA
jgi:acetoin:2,6-dichlorophenolindophenol oxidoreductase subunit alpha